ncbi:hypothetical protein [Paractinoplanes lichenicola]|uniref:Uncharacterized protein n=1 Tax=Paractinoplanes lichenicola TaxID=2802976 RepID=A0ABS1VU26_9ACTN|nr:hypothetical protein [Actinoplanes lichenicola]MBL7257987.1 hypothetical protein [Actinoplanes lichenicola]
MEILAVVTGLLAVLVSFLPGLTPGRRAFGILGGAGFAIYGIYVLNQDSGTWYFPIWLFLLPVVTIAGAARASARHE